MHLNIIDIASLVAANPGKSANALAKIAGVKLTHRGHSVAFYAEIKRICDAGAIVAREGGAAFGNVSTVYYAV